MVGIKVPEAGVVVAVIPEAEVSEEIRAAGVDLLAVDPFRRGRGGSAPRGGGGYTAQKRSFQSDEYQGSMTGSIEFVKKRKLNDNVYRILVPVRSVKSIIGPGGQNFKQLKESAGEGCKISIYTQGVS